MTASSPTPAVSTPIATTTEFKQLVMAIDPAIPTDHASDLLHAFYTAVLRETIAKQRAHHAAQGIPCAGPGCPVVEVMDLVDPDKTLHSVPSMNRSTMGGLS